MYPFTLLIKDIQNYIDLAKRTGIESIQELFIRAMILADAASKGEIYTKMPDGTFVLVAL